MYTRNLKGTVALGSLTAAVALLAGLSGAQAQSAPGAGSFPQSFLIPGTNTSLSLYGQVKAVWGMDIGQHDGDTQTTVNSVPFHTAQLALSGPGVGSGNTNVATEENSLQWRLARLRQGLDLHLRDSHAERSGRNQDRHVDGREPVLEPVHLLHRRHRHCRRLDHQADRPDRATPMRSVCCGPMARSGPG